MIKDVDGQTIRSRVIDKLADIKKIDPREVEDAVNQSAGGLEMDSKEALPIMANLETWLGIRLVDPDEVDDFQKISFNDLVDFVLEKVGQAS